MESKPHHEYRIAPELRRCCWYTIVGAIVLLIVFYPVARFVQNRGPVDILAVCVQFALLAAGMSYPLRWKLRLDEHGLARRRLFRWDFWPWADFATGRVDKLHPYTFCDPQRPWWRRKLRLGNMASGDIQDILSEINTYYQLPPPPDIPATITIQYGFRRSATFDANGIRLVVRGVPHEYRWSDLREIHLVRMDPMRRDFKTLTITLPDQELELQMMAHQGGTSPSWRGATSEELNEFFLRTVQADRIHVSISGEPLTKREHIEKKLRRAEKKRCEMAVVFAACTALIVASLVWMAVFEEVFKVILMAGMSVVFVGPLVVFVLRANTNQIKDLQTTLKSVETLSQCQRTSA